MHWYNFYPQVPTVNIANGVPTVTLLSGVTGTNNFAIYASSVDVTIFGNTTFNWPISFCEDLDVDYWVEF